MEDQVGQKKNNKDISKETALKFIILVGVISLFADMTYEGARSIGSIIEKYGLNDPALLRLAKIVHAADTGELGGEPIAQGLEAIAVGYSFRFPDDKENIKCQFAVYDALYAWCSLDVTKTAKRKG